MTYEQFRHKKQNKNIFLVDIKQEPHPYYSELMTRGINKILRNRGTIGIIVNKKSYAHGIICNQCGYIPQCTQCNISIAYHQPNTKTSFGMCHICKKTYKIPTKCIQCESSKIQPYGTGIEQVTQYIRQTHNITPLIIKSETANSLHKVKRLQKLLNTHPIHIGTSLLKMPPSASYRYDLIIVINADTRLNVPDYESNKNNFHYIYDIIVKHKSNNIIIQTQKPDYPSIRYACKGDKIGFEKRDQTFKKKHNYPPYGDICVIMYKHEIEKKVFSSVNKLYQELLYLKEKIDNKETKTSLEIYATPPLIYKMFNKYRYNIVIKGKIVRPFIEKAFQSLNITQRGFKIDRQAKELI